MTDKRISIAELRKKRDAANNSDLTPKSAENRVTSPEKQSVFVNRSVSKESEHKSFADSVANKDRREEQTSTQHQNSKVNRYNPQEEYQAPERTDSYGVSDNNDYQGYRENTTQQPPQKNIFEDEINLLDYLEIAYRYKFMIILVTIALILSAYLYSLHQTPVYKAETKLLINNDIMELNVINQKATNKEQMQLSTWIQIIKSSDVAARVSKYLDGQASPGEVKNSLDCSTERDEERIINLSISHTDPNIAALIANNYYNAVNDYDMSIRTDNYAKTIRYIEEQLERNNRELDSLNVSIERLYRRHNYKNFSGDIEENFKRLSGFKDILSNTEVELEAENANITALKTRLKEEDSEYTTETTYSEPLKMRLLNLEVDLARTLTSYGENHPKVIGIKQNIANITTLIEEGAEQNIQLKSVGNNPLKQQILSDLIKSETMVISLTQRKIALVRIIDSMELDPEVASLLNDLHRQKDALNSIIINLQTQVSEMRLSSSVDAYRIVQLEQAVVPSKPSNNKMKLNLLIGTILGLGLGFGLSMLLNMFDNKIRNIKELVKNFPHVPVVGTVPKLAFSPMELDILTQKDSSANNQAKDTVLAIFNEIALNFKYLIMNKEHNLIGVISSIKGEGKSTISNYLAIALARNNTKVLLVDADFYNPRISRYYGYNKLPGFSEVVTEQINIEDAIIETRFENLFVLPSGKLPPSVNKLYHGDKFADYINSIKEFADIVIVDTPAYMYFPETSILISHLDYSLLTVKMNVTTTKSVNRVFKKLSIINTSCSGFIANSVLNDLFDTAYNDYYSYGYEYYYDTLEDGTKKRKKRYKSKTDYKEESDTSLDSTTSKRLLITKNKKSVLKKNLFSKAFSSLKDFLGLTDYIDIEDDDESDDN